MSSFQWNWVNLEISYGIQGMIKISSSLHFCVDWNFVVFEQLLTKTQPWHNSINITQIWYDLKLVIFKSVNTLKPNIIHILLYINLYMRTFKVTVMFGFESPGSQVGVVKLSIPNLVRILVRFFICWDVHVESPPIIRFYRFVGHLTSNLYYYHPKVKMMWGL